MSESIYTATDMGNEVSKTEKAYQWFEIESIDGITLDDLKRRFKRSLASHHPDRGGKEGDFEKIIDAYEYLSALIKRTMGGRNQHAVIDVADLIKQRDRDFVTEMNNMIADVFDEVDRRQLDDFHITFNQSFQKHAKPLIADGGYDDWLKDQPFRDYTFKTPEELMTLLQEQRTLRGLDEKGPMDDIKLDVPLPPDFQKDFVSSIRSQHPDRVQDAIILHPMEMAVVDGRCYGTDIIRREKNYHSSMYVNPEYVDLMEAYTSVNTVIDKLVDYEDKPIPTMDEIITNRSNDIYEHVNDEDMKQVYEYERRYFENEARQQQEVEGYFKTAGSSAWALRDTHIQTVYRDVDNDGDEKSESS